MYPALKQRAADPWQIQPLNVYVHSLEGFTYYLYWESAAVAEDFDDRAFEKWIGETLGLPELSGRLEDGRQAGLSFAQRMVWVLEATDYGRSLSQETFLRRIESSAGRARNAVRK